MSKLRIGFVLTGSFCTFAKVIPVIQALIERGDSVTPILSDSAGTLDTRFGTAAHWRHVLSVASCQLDPHFLHVCRKRELYAPLPQNLANLSKFYEIQATVASFNPAYESLVNFQ